MALGVTNEFVFKCDANNTSTRTNIGIKTANDTPSYYKPRSSLTHNDGQKIYINTRNNISTSSVRMCGIVSHRIAALPCSISNSNHCHTCVFVIFIHLSNIKLLVIAFRCTLIWRRGNGGFLGNPSTWRLWPSLPLWCAYWVDARRIIMT